MAGRPAYLRTVGLRDGHPTDTYPFDIPAIRSLDHVEFAPLTVFVGDNGSGKSTLIEAIAVAAGFNPEGATATWCSTPTPRTPT